jgi:hypothetical protein
VFSIELVNADFNDAFAIANNVPTSQGTITVTMPTIPVGCVVHGKKDIPPDSPAV